MKFTKMQGAGNDFVLINNLEEKIPEAELPALARELCARRLSVGADGLMVVEAPRQGGDYRMLFFNADGSLGEMCGNGARCIARYGYEHGLAGETQRVETTAGLVVGRRVDRRMYEVRLNDPSVLEASRRAEAGGAAYDCGYAELGNPGIPHAVLRMDDWEERPADELRRLGRSLRYASAFPRGANVTFWRRVGTDHFKVVTYERGVEDFTLACGTGCGSAAAVLTLQGEASGRGVRLDCPGGELSVTLTVRDGIVSDILLTGPTRVVAVGETVE